jgi:hypothetical protein
MEGFYTHLVSGLSVAEALHTAKLHYLKNDAIPASRQTPYFWAGMVAVGADRKVALEGYPGGALGLLLLSALALWLYFISRKNRKSHQSANKPNGRRG